MDQDDDLLGLHLANVSEYVKWMIKYIDIFITLNKEQHFF